MISIVMLTFNAPIYVSHTIKTLAKTEGIDYELVVLDNASDEPTQKVLKDLKQKGYIDKLIFSPTNTFFARGNNIGVEACSEKSTHILLLNSDIEIRDKYWLKKLVEIHRRGTTSYGLCDTYPHVRGDGYCILIDKDIYLQYKLDESFEWWWSVTKLQAEILNAGFSVIAVDKHETMLHHYGGMSGTAWQNAKGMSVEGETVKKWFEKGEVVIIPEVIGQNKVTPKFNIVNVYSVFAILWKNLNRITRKLKAKLLHRESVEPT